MFGVNKAEGIQEFIARSGLSQRSNPYATSNTGLIPLNGVQQQALLFVGKSGSTSGTNVVVLIGKPAQSIPSERQFQVTPASIVDLARSVFALSVSDSAAVFGVSRPTIYEWSNVQNLDDVRAYKAKSRLLEIYKAATLWNSFSPLKGRWLNQPLESGKTILDLLKAASINIQELTNAYAELSRLQPALIKDEHERVKSGMSGLRSAFTSLSAAQKSKRG